MLTHTELCKIGEKFLKSINCSVIVIEPSSMCNEKPDVIGWNGGKCFVGEAKTYRSDFLRDCLKPFRIDPSLGMGDMRFYIVPEGLIKYVELPEGWFLVEVGDDKKVSKITGFPNWMKATHHGNKANENLVLLSLLRRSYE